MNNITKYNNKTTQIAFHLIVWLVLFSLPYLLSSGQSQTLSRLIGHSWIPLCFYAIIFYLNYLFLIPKFLFNKKFGMYLTLNIILIVGLVFLKHRMMSLDLFDMMPKPPKFDDYPGIRSHRKMRIEPSKSFFYYIDFISFIVPIVFANALSSSEKWIKAEGERKQIENAKLESELQHLKYQLQPHFFFNSLNNIYSLVDISPEKAKKSIHSLSKLMRYLLYESNEEKVSLSKEIEFLKKYIDLMRLRISENTTIIADFPEVNENIKIAPLLFISVVENAFKHGISATEPSSLVFNMNYQDNQVKFLSKNKNFPKHDEDKSGSGIGLQNIKQRLSLLYPEKHIFLAEISEEDFVVNITINLT